MPHVDKPFNPELNGWTRAPDRDFKIFQAWRDKSGRIWLLDPGVNYICGERDPTTNKFSKFIDNRKTS